MVRARLAAPELLLFALLAAWSVIPLIHLAVHLHGGSLTGADGPFPGDQLQYLAWARDSGTHVLAGDLFEIPAGNRVFVHPMWLVSGVLWRLGVSIVLASLLWKPVAVAALLLALRAYARRMVPSGAWKRAAVILLALFYVSPFYGKAGELVGEVFTAGQLWGYLPIALAVALMPVYLLALERAVQPENPRQQRWLLTAGGAGALLAWLHPWQGETMVICTGALIVWRRGRDAVRLLGPLVATSLPLVGYVALSHLDPAWRQADGAGQIPPGSLLTLLAELGPVTVFSILGVRRPRGDIQEQALLLWPFTAVIQYYLLAPSSSAAHSLDGIAIPLAVLAVRGMDRIARSQPRAWVRALALGVITLALTAPGAIHVARSTLRLIGSGREGQIIAPSDRAALSYLAAARGDGGVLAAPPIGAVIPAFTGKPTWVGHPLWTPAYDERVRIADALAAGSLPPAQARQQVTDSKARYLLEACGSSGLSRILGPLVASRHDFGCASVYTLR